MRRCIAYAPSLAWELLQINLLAGDEVAVDNIEARSWETHKQTMQIHQLLNQSVTKHCFNSTLASR